MTSELVKIIFTNSLVKKVEKRKEQKKSKKIVDGKNNQTSNINKAH